ncbi:hypothetical protein RP20_CCG010586 [Aedes albopictus]|nr:hypothetical protein RP20_CCG010586 [Aedes albopictus]
MQLSSAALRENEPCMLNDNTPGICRPYATCREKVTSNNIKFCEHNAKGAIICCPIRKATSRTTLRSGRSLWKTSRKCSEYQKLANHDVAAVGLSLASVVSISRVPTCDSISASLIVGGTPAKPKEFPHMAALGWRRPSDNTTFFRCGGTLISERFIMTAAHCLVHIEGAFPSFVRLGDVHLLRDDDEARPRDYEIKDYILHRNFRRKNGMYNDIALLKLTKDVAFNDYIRPACLYGEETAPSETAIATGYGKLAYEADFSNELMKVALQIYDKERCNKNYAGIKELREGMKDGQLCAGDTRGGYDTCKGDSGGPLQITEQGNHCSFIVFGITSMGQYCGGTTPAIYTRVAAYLDWIEGIVWP